MTNSVTGPRRSSEAFPKTKLAPRNVMVTVSWSTAGLIHYRFLNPGETITSEKCSANWWDALNYNACSQYCSTEWTQLSTTVPDCKSHDQCFKSWKNWVMKFCLICHIHLASHQLLLLQASQPLFAGKRLLQPAGGRKCFPRVLWILKHGFLC